MKNGSGDGREYNYCRYDRNGTKGLGYGDPGLTNGSGNGNGYPKMIAGNGRPVYRMDKSIYTCTYALVHVLIVV